MKRIHCSCGRIGQSRRRTCYIPPLLRAISFHLDHIGQAVEILWRLAKSDTRPPHQYPEHASRILEEMSEYGRYKPIIFNDWMADFATTKCSNPREFESSFTPLNIAEKLLAKEGKFTESEGFTISFGGFSLNYPAIRVVREKALGIVNACLNSDDSKIAMKATKSIAGILSGYLPMIGHVVSEEEKRWQMDERLSAIRMVETTLTRAKSTPLLRQIRSVLRHARPHASDTALGNRINEVLAKIPQQRTC
jgi:hypothetical protein